MLFLNLKFHRETRSFITMTHRKISSTLAALVVASGSVFATATITAHYQMGELEASSGAIVGGGDNMFNAASGRRAIEGKDIGNGYSSSYFPGTFGLQGWHSDWSLYDAENLQAKAVGWEATYGLSLSQAAIDNSGEKDAIFEAFPAWQNARALGLFTKAIRERLKDPDFKFHLEQTGQKSFILYQGKQLQTSTAANGTPVALTNPYAAQNLQMAIRMHGSSSALAADIVVTLPGGRRITTSQAMAEGGFIIIKSKPGVGISVALPDGSPVKTRPVITDGKVVYTHGDTAYLADGNRKKAVGLKLDQRAVLPAGAANFSVTAPAGASYDLTVWAFGKGEALDN